MCFLSVTGNTQPRAESVLGNSQRRPKRQRAANDFRTWADQLELLFELEHGWKLRWGQKLFWEVFKWEVASSSEIRER